MWKSPEERALEKKLNIPSWIDDVLKPQRGFHNQHILDQEEARKIAGNFQANHNQVCVKSDQDP